MTGKKLDDREIELDLEGAEASWPKFFMPSSKTILLLGQGLWRILRQLLYPPAAGEIEIAEEVDQKPPLSPKDSTYCQSRASTTGGDSGEEYEQQEEEAKEDEVEIITPPAKKKNKGEPQSKDPAEKRQDVTLNYPIPSCIHSHPRSFSQSTENEKRKNTKRRCRRKQWLFKPNLSKTASDLNLRVINVNVASTIKQCTLTADDAE